MRCHPRHQRYVVCPYYSHASRTCINVLLWTIVSSIAPCDALDVTIARTHMYSLMTLVTNTYNEK